MLFELVLYLKIDTNFLIILKQKKHVKGNDANLHRAKNDGGDGNGGGDGGGYGGSGVCMVLWLSVIECKRQQSSISAFLLNFAIED